ncbi:hypothetical protein ACFLTU_01935 [Bacteroidota bacterium]
MRRQTILLLLTFLTGTVFPQIGPEYREMFLEAESYFLFEEYIEALPYYEPIHKQYPDNDNISYKMGVCYLNDPYRKAESIGYLEKASQNINLKFKENSFKETKAPLEAFFYLGNAYRINAQLDKAIETYKHFKSLADPELYDLELVDEQIRACENAKELEKRPVDLEIQNLGDRINTRFSDVHPVISGDESKIVYIQKQPFYDAVAYCEKMEDGWSFPRILMEELSVDEDAYPTALNYEGDELILYRSDNFIGDLYTSKLVDGFWTPLVRMNDNINTKYWESHACFSITGDTLYFTSNRKDGYGGLDIYYSIRTDAGDWGVPVNLGPTINTRYNEESPFLTNDGKTLYFSSYGHYNMGGYDVFYSTVLEDGEWSVPINAGYPINTTDDDVFFVPVRNGTFAYFPRLLDDGYGRTDIYLYEIYSETHPRKFQVSGILGIETVKNLTRTVRIAVIEQQSRDTVAIAIPDPETGEFSFEAPAGEYELLVEGDDIEPTTTAFVISKDYREKDFELKQAILLTQAKRLEEIIIIQDDISVKDTLILVDTGDPLEIELTLERRANLYVNVFQDEKQVSQDSFPVEKRRFIYSYLPVPGDNLLKFKLIDRQGNLSYKDVRIVFTPVSGIDGLTDAEDSLSQTKMEEGLQDYLDRLTKNATGDLKTFLAGVDLEALDIMTAEQLEQYLVEQSASQEYSAEDVDLLLVVTPEDEQEATELLRQKFVDVSKGDLQDVLGELNLAEEGIDSEEQLILWLREHVDEYNYTRQDINDLVLDNLQSEYLAGYTDQLLHLSDNDSLNQALNELDLSEISNLQELYERLLAEADNYGYEAEDVNYLFSRLSQREELNELHGNLSELASGDLLRVLEELDPDEEGIKNSVELISHLMDEAENNDYTREDAIILLLDYMETEDLREIIKLLIGTSSGELLNLLLNLDVEQNRIQTIDDLYAFLMEQAKFYGYSEDDIIRLFLNLLKIIDHEPMIEEIPVPPSTDDEGKSGKAWIFYILGGIVLIILILLYSRRRRKSEKEDETS